MKKRLPFILTLAGLVCLGLSILAMNYISSIPLWLPWICIVPATLLFVISFYICFVKAFQKGSRALHLSFLFLNILAALYTLCLGFLTLFAQALKDVHFSAWGRPLRIRKKIVHAVLVPGSEWARGPKSDCSGLDAVTREVLARLWYYDAQKEHASVPAFSRLIWILTSLGAYPHLLEKLHYCGLQEIEHARRTLAMANTYSGIEKTFADFPAMQGEKLGFFSNAWAELAEETLLDGCLIEDFNADLAEEASHHVADPAAAQMIRIILKEERYHAAVAWEILEYCLKQDPDAVEKKLRDKLERMPELSVSLSSELRSLIRRSNQAELLRHGRVPEEKWLPIYQRRLDMTRSKVARLLTFTRGGELASYLPDSVS